MQPPGAAALQAQGAPSYTRTGRRKPPMAREIKVAEPGEIAPGQSRLVEEAGLPIAVFNVSGELFAISNECPHRLGPLHEGYLEGFLVTCPWHGWQFDLRTGVCDTIPGRDITTYPVRSDATGVFVTLPD